MGIVLSPSTKQHHNRAFSSGLLVDGQPVDNLIRFVWWLSSRSWAGHANRKGE